MLQNPKRLEHRRDNPSANSTPDLTGGVAVKTQGHSYAEENFLQAAFMIWMNHKGISGSDSRPILKMPSYL
jgi:hypothetical protein